MIRLSILSSCIVLLMIAFLDDDFHVHGQSFAQELPYRRNNRAYYNAANTIKKGIQIVKSLLFASKRVDPGTTNSKIYVKKGGIEKLKTDFYRFNPTEIRMFQLANKGTGKAAKIADRIVIYKSKGEEGVPQLEIYKAKDIDRRAITGKAFSELERDVIRYIE